MIRDTVMKKELPIDIDNFRTIREGNYYYIDRTLMIKDIMKTKHTVTLITRPYQFGKTTAMTMLREFFDITTDSQALFEGLAIMGTAYAECINSRPVIYLGLKECIGSNVEAMKFKIAERLAEEYEKYRVLFAQKEIDESMRVYRGFSAMCDMLDEVTLRDQDISHHLLAGSLACLMKAVYTCYQVKPLVLIDDYDQGIIWARRQGFRKEIVDFFAEFFGAAFHGEANLGQAVMTGYQGMARERVFSKINDLSVYTLRSKHYTKYLGLTVDEVQGVFDYYEMNHGIYHVHTFDDGYQFGKNQRMYRPKSIFTFVKEIRSACDACTG